MISYLTSADMSIIAFIGVIFAFALTCIAIAKLNKFLPKDLGRQFAVDGKLSAGKPRGAGIIFIFTFVISAVLFSQINAEIAIYLVLIVIEMLTGRLNQHPSAAIDYIKSGETHYADFYTDLLDK